MTGRMSVARSSLVLLLMVGLSLASPPEAWGEPGSSALTGALQIQVENLQNLGQGQLLVLVYEKVDRVEVNGVKFVRRKIVPVTGERVSVRFPDLPHGDYAVAVLHDMDEDLEADANFIGIPREDLGVSNNAKGGPLGGPKWRAAKFSHREQETRLSIKMWRCYR